MIGRGFFLVKAVNALLVGLIRRDVLLRAEKLVGILITIRIAPKKTHSTFAAFFVIGAISPPIDTKPPLPFALLQIIWSNTREVVLECYC